MGCGGHAVGEFVPSIIADGPNGGEHKNAWLHHSAASAQAPPRLLT
jgi:hypothetical protein